MQTVETEQVTVTVNRGPKCSVCNHSELKAINALLADASISRRGIAKQFKLNDASVDRHFHRHLAAKLAARGVNKRTEEAEDIYKQRHEHLYRESLQYIEDAKLAVKMQKVSVEVDSDDGPKLIERYESFRDVGAMAPAIGCATALQRQLGDATARFSQPGPGSGVNVHLSVILPRAVEQQPAIDVARETSELDVIDVPAIESPTSE